MLSKTYRFSLAKPQTFNQKQVAGQIVLQVVAKNIAFPKFAVVVPSKFCKTAVDRNKTKRLVWQSLDKLKEEIKPGVYKVLIIDNFSQLNLNQVATKIEKVFAKGGYLK